MVHFLDKKTPIPTSTTDKTNLFWFKSSSKKPSNFVDENYDDSDQYEPTSKIETTVTTNSLLSVSPRQQIDLISTKSNWKVISINTPPVKRYHPQQYPGVSERNAVGIQADGMKNFIIHPFRELDVV
ncbi:hypothetical protein I4U23_001124 [Adineta vaga]|nr:hypothetical protein I4U23_001124 [Adineta vaga]